jgi:hypothetical protein
MMLVVWKEIVVGRCCRRKEVHQVVGIHHGRHRMGTYVGIVVATRNKFVVVVGVRTATGDG